MTKQKPLILISNDDGYSSKGIKALIETAIEFGDVVVVAPDGPQSGKSSAITVEYPLRATVIREEEGCKVFKVNGTPVDCTKLAINTLLDRKPDFILAGINHGHNAGNSAIYSGTMGIVFEGSFLEIPSIAFSLDHHSADADFEHCKPIVREVIGAVIANGLPTDVCLNVNIPKEIGVKGIKVTKAARGRWTEEFEKRQDPHGRPYYWLTGKYISYEPQCKDNDLYWLAQGYASVVPCRADQTAFSDIDNLKGIIK